MSTMTTAAPTGVGPTSAPDRRAMILRAAVRLLSERGFTQVTMADIGREVGVVASAIYWHFPSKQTLLVEMFDDCLDRLQGEQMRVCTEHGGTWAGVRALSAHQIRFVLDEKALARVYHRESRHLPEAEVTRLRERQRSYVEVWSHLLAQARGEADPARAQALVHVSIGAIQSALSHRSPLSPEEWRAVLLDSALRVQGDPGNPA